VIHRIELCLRACAFLRALALDLYRSLAASATLATRLRSVVDPWGVRTWRLACVYARFQRQPLAVAHQ